MAVGAGSLGIARLLGGDARVGFAGEERERVVAHGRPSSSKSNRPHVLRSRSGRLGRASESVSGAAVARLPLGARELEPDTLRAQNAGIAGGGTEAYLAALDDLTPETWRGSAGEASCERELM